MKKTLRYSMIGAGAFLLLALSWRSPSAEPYRECSELPASTDQWTESDIQLSARCLRSDISNG